MNRRIAIELAIANGDAERTLKLSQPLLNDLRRNGRFRSLIRIGILRSVALSLDGQTKRSWREMSTVLAMARERNFVGSFFELRHLCLPIIDDILTFRASQDTEIGDAIVTPAPC